MPQIIPFNNEGCRTIDIALGDNMFRMRTYYLPYTKTWLMDIMDQEDNPIISGIALNPGVDNLVKGKAKIFQNQTIRCITVEGTDPYAPESLGVNLFVVYYEEDETPPKLWEDKMLGD